ncbi:hypothetical protein Alg130_11984 [Pyrenophora tritici-repentis]|nr:hypothetical protein Alg130_11984 [Pyrenophora tritici-repentis]KAI0569011.1 hypothetical protein Alg215_11885 [Pyrenophora tritici-repentis]
MAKLTFIATVAVLLSAVVAQHASVPDSCCPKALLACRNKRANGCVATDAAQLCVNQSSDNGCKIACRRLLGQSPTSNNFFLYIPAGGSAQTCYCTQFDASRIAESTCG